MHILRIRQQIHIPRLHLFPEHLYKCTYQIYWDVSIPNLSGTFSLLIHSCGTVLDFYLKRIVGKLFFSSHSFGSCLGIIFWTSIPTLSRIFHLFFKLFMLTVIHEFLNLRVSLDSELSLSTFCFGQYCDNCFLLGPLIRWDLYWTWEVEPKMVENHIMRAELYHSKQNKP